MIGKLDMFLNYIYFDPSPIFFTIPGINWPVAWYGLLFAFGVYLTYLGTRKLCREFFLERHQFFEGDIISFERLIMSLRDDKHGKFLESFKSTLSNDLKTYIDSWNCHTEITLGFKEQIVKAFNQFLETGEDPGQIDILTVYGKAIELSPLKKESLKRRFRFEMLLKGSFVSLKEKAEQICEKIMFHVVWAVTLGARLAHIVFYENLTTYLANPSRIFKVWEGGLASHGAFLFGVLAVLFFMNRYKKSARPLKCIDMLDAIFLMSFVAFFFIRIGNLINQEILGIETTVSWGVVFGHPADGVFGAIRHPVQIYEAFSYLFVWVVFYKIRKKYLFITPGFMTFSLCSVGLSLRFFWEFFKIEQSAHALSYLTMGQILTMPGILIGLYGLIKVYKKSKRRPFSKTAL